MQNDQGCYGVPNRTQGSGSLLMLDGGNGFGSGSTAMQRFTTVRRLSGSDFIYVDDPVKGAVVQIKTPGVYYVNYTFNDNAGQAFGIYVNPTSADATANPQSSGGVSTLYAVNNVAASGNNSSVAMTAPLKAGDKIQLAANSAAPATGVYNIRLIVARVG